MSEFVKLGEIIQAIMTILRTRRELEERIKQSRASENALYKYGREIEKRHKAIEGKLE